jgi:hypothetical protein
MRYLVMLISLLVFFVLGVLPGGCVVAISDGLSAGLGFVFWGFVILCIVAGLSGGR